MLIICQFICCEGELSILRFSVIAWQATCGPEFTEFNQETALLLSGIQFWVNFRLLFRTLCS